MTVSDERLAEHLQRFDRDGSQSIDFAGFRDLLDSLGVHRSTGVMRSLFERIDRDGSGRISTAEFVAWWRESDSTDG